MLPDCLLLYTAKNHKEENAGEREVATGMAGAGKIWPHLEVKAFPRDDNTWKIDWFGGVEFVNRAARWSQPSVEVFLSKVVGQDSGADVTSPAKRKFTFGASFASTAQSGDQISCWVTVGTLVILQAGDLWRNGCLIGRKDAAIESFKQICVDKPAAGFIKAGFSGSGGFVLPLAEHPWHRKSTNSWCVHITLEDGRSLVVPCFELIRFYFGSSSSLLTQLFRSDLEPEHLYDVNETNVWPSRKLSWLELAPDMPPRSAADIARIAGDGAARRAAILVGRSCAAAEAGQRFPRMGFPFTGVTDLVAEGEWLSYGEKPKQTFIVRRILSCSHPFPFSNLHYKVHVSVPGSSIRAPSAQTFKAEGRSGNIGDLTQPEATTLVEHDAGHLGVRPMSFMEERKRRFIDLDSKYVGRRKGSETFSGRSTQGASTPIEDAAIGLPGSSRNIRPVELLEWTDNRDQAPECLFPLIQALDEAQVSFQVIIDFEDRFLRCYAKKWLAQPDLFNVIFMPMAEGLMGPLRFRQLGLLVAERDGSSALWVVIEYPDYVARWHPLVEPQTDQAFDNELIQSLVFQALCEFPTHQRQGYVERNHTECARVEVQCWLARELDLH